MKQACVFTKKGVFTFLSVMILLFSFVFDVQADQGRKRGNDSNWTSPMGTPSNGEGGLAACIMPGPGDILEFETIVRVSVKQVDQFPEIYVYYEFQNNSTYTGIVGPVDEASLTPLLLGTGEWVFEWRESIQIDLSSECMMANAFCGDMHYVMITPDDANSYNLYPTGAYPVLFDPEDFYDVGGPGTYAHYYSHKKSICCEDPISNVGSSICNGGDGISTLVGMSPPFPPPYLLAGPDKFETTGDAMSLRANSGNVEKIDAFDEVIVAPNPFSDATEVHFVAEQTGAVDLEWFDLQGVAHQRDKTMVSHTGRQRVKMNTTALPPGIYYLRISSAEGAKMIKVLKM